MLQKQVSNFLSEQLPPFSLVTLFFLTHSCTKNKSTFLDFIFLKTWKQFPCHGHFHGEILWFSPVKILHRHRAMAAGTASLRAPSAQQCRGDFLWGSPSLGQLTWTYRAGKLHFSCLHWAARSRRQPRHLAWGTLISVPKFDSPGPDHAESSDPGGVAAVLWKAFTSTWCAMIINP